MIGGPPRGHAAQSWQRLVTTNSESFDRLIGPKAAQGYSDAPILDGAGEVPDRSEHNRAKGREFTGLVVFARAADHVPSPAVACIEHTPEIFVFPCISIGLVEQKSRPYGLDGAKKRCAPNVRS